MLIDVLIVVDNSASMSQEQQKLAAAATQLFDSLGQLTGMLQTAVWAG